MSKRHRALKRRRYYLAHPRLNLTELLELFYKIKRSREFPNRVFNPEYIRLRDSLLPTPKVDASKPAIAYTRIAALYSAEYYQAMQDLARAVLCRTRAWWRRFERNHNTPRAREQRP